MFRRRYDRNFSIGFALYGLLHVYLSLYFWNNCRSANDHISRRVCLREEITVHLALWIVDGYLGLVGLVCLGSVMAGGALDAGEWFDDVDFQPIGYGGY